MTLMCLCKSFEGLIAARVFLGLTEAGLFPGITFYLSLWYRRRDAAQRLAIFFSAATIAGAFGGLLAWCIEHMEGIGGLYGWQWIVSESTPTFDDSRLMRDIYRSSAWKELRQCSLPRFRISSCTT